MTKITTRFAPSPTGFLHIGGARTALFSFLYAKKHGGDMILRIEDTDKERSNKDFEADILAGLEWLSIDYSEIYRQSERGDIYKKFIESLISEDKAYVSKEKGGERNEVIRLRNSGKEVVFNDLIRGEIKTDTMDLGDFVIAKSLDEPVFHFANVVDDHDMGVTHVIRGEDHISNTPRQILIREALGFDEFTYAHLPLILGPDKSKLSKRHGAVSVTEYKKNYLSEAFTNYLALLGWNPGDDREVFTMKELIKEFSLEKAQKGGAVFDLEKLNWINKQHLRRINDSAFKNLVSFYLPKELKDSKLFDKIIPLIKERIHKFGDIQKMSEDGEFDFYLRVPQIESSKIIWKNDTLEETRENLNNVILTLERIQNFSLDEIKTNIQPIADEIGRGKILHPMRFSLSGRDKSPDPFTIASIIGKEETIKRLKKAVKTLF